MTEPQRPMVETHSYRGHPGCQDCPCWFGGCGLPANAAIHVTSKESRMTDPQSPTVEGILIALQEINTMVLRLEVATAERLHAALAAERERILRIAGDHLGELDRDSLAAAIRGSEDD